MPKLRPMLDAATGYLREHPEELLRIARNAASMRVGVPLAALRWLAGRLRGKRAPRDVEIEAVPPGVRFTGSVDLMGTLVRASALVFVEGVRLSSEELRLEVRLAEVSLKLLDPSADTPIAGLIKSGALDLSKPGNLVAFMPKRPAVLIDAQGDRIVLDLMKHPKLANNGRAGRIVGIVTPILNVRAVKSENEHLDVVLRAFPEGVSNAVASVRARL